MRFFFFGGMRFVRLPRFIFLFRSSGRAFRRCFSHILVECGVLYSIQQIKKNSPQRCHGDFARQASKAADFQAASDLLKCGTTKGSDAKKQWLTTASLVGA